MANFQDSIPSSRGANGSANVSTMATELLRLQEEQRRLQERQDLLDRELQQAIDAAAATTERNPGGKDKDEKAEARGEPKKEEGEEEEKEEPKPPLKERLATQWREHRGRSIGIGVAAIAVLVGAGAWYVHARHHEDTDDAQIDADISQVSPRVTGTVTGVYFVDNQVVKAGDLLVDLDPRDYEVAVVQAKAEVDQAEAQLFAERPNVPIAAVETSTQVSTSSDDVSSAVAELAAAEHDYAKSKADVEQALANDGYAQVEQRRMARLAAIGAVAPSQADQRTSQAGVTAATVESMRKASEAARTKVDEQRARVASAQKKAQQAEKNAPQQVASKQAQVKLREAAVEAARAKLQQAELNRSYLHIVAPVDGIVGQKSVQIGDRIQPGQTLVSVSRIDNVWVTANYRETQLEKMHPHQKVVVHVDALDLDFAGEVESMPGASGARFSLLPPENATGNYVKVVQRLPVRIKLEPGQKGYDRLRPGMSVEPNVTLD